MVNYDRAVIMFDDESHFAYIFLFQIIIKYLNSQVLQQNLKILTNANTIRGILLRIQPLLISEKVKIRF